MTQAASLPEKFNLEICCLDAIAVPSVSVVYSRTPMNSCRTAIGAASGIIPDDLPAKDILLGTRSQHGGAQAGVAYRSG